MYDDCEKMSGDHHFDGWKHKEAAKYATKIAKEYGPPSESSKHAAKWYDVCGLYCLLIMDEAVAHAYPMDHNDFCYGTRKIQVETKPGYGVFKPEGGLEPGIVSDFAKITGSVQFDGLKGEVCARCGNIEAVVKTLAFVEEVIEGKTKCSRDAYARAVEGEKMPEWYDDAKKKDEEYEEEMSGEMELVISAMPVKRKDEDYDY